MNIQEKKQILAFVSASSMVTFQSCISWISINLEEVAKKKVSFEGLNSNHEGRVFISGW